MKYFVLLAFAMALPGGLFAEDYGFRQLENEAGKDALSLSIPGVPDPAPKDSEGLPQYLPPDNDDPGFSWDEVTRRVSGDYIVTGSSGARFSPDISGSEGGGKSYELAAETIYKLDAEPDFEADKIKVEMQTPFPGCSLKVGYLDLTSVEDTSAGGLSDLPPTVKAFMDMLAFAEDTREAYNLQFTHKPFVGYADHPRQKICTRRYCSTAAGRYQFLAKTWDQIARKLGLADFSPPNQDRAAMELIRRAGAYEAVLNSYKKTEFKYAIHRVRNIWAALPGNRYGQPAKSMSTLWKVYREALARYGNGARS